MRTWIHTLLHGHCRFAPLPRAAGMDVRISVFLLFFMALAALTLGGAALYTRFTARTPAPGAVLNAVAMLAAVAAWPFWILLHELGHVLAARRVGQRATATVLHALGGVTRFVGRPPSTGQEMKLALAGPLASLAGAALLWAWALFGPRGGDGWQALGRFAQYAAFFQLGLALVNFLPMPLLDGGRVALAVCVKAKGADDGARWAEHAALGGLVLGVALAGMTRSWLWLAMLVYLYVIGRSMAHERRRMAAAMAHWPRPSPGSGPGGRGERVTGGDFFFGTGHLSEDDAPRDDDAPFMDEPLRPADAPPSPGWRARRQARKAEARLTRAAQAAAAEQAELARLVEEESRLLRKIRTDGLDRLTAGERETLNRLAELRRHAAP